MLNEYRQYLNDIIESTIFKSSTLSKEQLDKIQEIKKYLQSSPHFIEDLRTLLNTRNNEIYFAYNPYIKDFFQESPLDIKLKVLENTSSYEDIITDKTIYLDIWSTLPIENKIAYLENKKKYSDIDIMILNDSISYSGNFHNNTILNEILTNDVIRKKIPTNSLKLNYSYNLLSLINLIDYNVCHILTQETYTKFLLKKCKTFPDFTNLYNSNKKIYNLIQNNSLIFSNKYDKEIYQFILNNPNFISKFNNKYISLFSLSEMTKFNNLKSLNSDSKSVVLSTLYSFDKDNASALFSEDNLLLCSKHSISVYPFDNLNKKLKDKIFTNYDLFNRFIDTIIIEAISNSFQEDDILNILRNDVFIEDMSSYAIELLLNKLTFKSTFNMLQRKNIFDKIVNLNVKVNQYDTIFIKGFLDSPSLIYKSEHNMIHEMLNLLNQEDTLYYLSLPYIIKKLSNYELINLCLNKKLNIKSILSNKELKDKMNITDIISLIDKYFETSIDLTLFQDKELSKLLFNIPDSLIDSIDFDEVNYLFETIRMKSILSKQESPTTVLSYKSILSSYLLFGIEETIKIVNNGNSNITLDEIKKLQTTVVNEKILLYKENNSSIFQNMAKKLTSNLQSITFTNNYADFALNLRKNTYIDSVIYLMLENNFDSYNNIIDKFFSYLKYYHYDKFASNKEIYDYSNDFIAHYLNKLRTLYNKDFETIILKNFKVKESIMYLKRKTIARHYLSHLKFTIFINTLTATNKETYQKYFVSNYDLDKIEQHYIKYLANDKVDFPSILEHVLIPKAHNHFDKVNCLSKLGIDKPANTDAYTTYLNDLKIITNINAKIKKLTSTYATPHILNIMSYILYNTNLTFKINKKDLKSLDKIATKITCLNGEVYIDKTALKFIYKNNIDIYNIEEITEYNNYLAILDNILKKTTMYINKYMVDEAIENDYAHEFYKTVNNASYQFNITNKYYEPQKRVLSLHDLEIIFNGFDITEAEKMISKNHKLHDKTLYNFLIDKKNLIMVADGYYQGLVDNLGLIISKWPQIIEYIDSLELDINSLTLIGLENILNIINFENNPLGRTINKEIINSLYDTNYYEIPSLEQRIQILITLKKESLKKITSSIPYLCYKDDTYKVEIIDSYNEDILKVMPDSLYRIGCIGNDFLHYSILNKNGFQLGIYENNILVAKILGLRNGNTIYLNALEGKYNPHYNELLKLFANELISITRNTNEPIDFVTILNNDNFNDLNSLELDTTICPIIDNPLNKDYYDFQEFTTIKNLINPYDIYTNYPDNISTLLASSKVVDKNNFQYYDAEAKYYRRRNNAIKLSNNLSEEYLKKIDTILYLCKLEDDTINIDNINLNSIKTIYLGDDYCLFVTDKDNILKYVLPYDERAKKEIVLLTDEIEKELT